MKSLYKKHFKNQSKHSTIKVKHSSRYSYTNKIDKIQIEQITYVWVCWGGCAISRGNSWILNQRSKSDILSRSAARDLTVFFHFFKNQ